ncbi:ElyC/SanA/YdcF family protein [Shewanella sp. 0m-11]
MTLSRFTFEDATLAKSIVEQHRFNEMTLVTSAFHMPRAIADIKLNYCTARSTLSTEKLQQLETHEMSVMNRERRNLANYFE